MSEVVCEWGLAGIKAWRARASVFVIVDVLSFSTAVSVAVDRGAKIIPFPLGDHEAALIAAREHQAVVASPKRTAEQQLSLSPTSLQQIQPGTKLLLPSPNGSRLSLATGNIPTICGSFRNFEAVANAARALAHDGLIAVIPAGERWQDDSLRPAIEDWLGAGAIISALRCKENTEARLARSSFEQAKDNLFEMISGCVSGQELICRGFEDDVKIAVETGKGRAAPYLVEGMYTTFT